MKIVIIEVYQLSPEIDTGVEIANIFANQGHDVTYIHFGRKLPYIAWHRKHYGIFKHLIWLNVKANIKKSLVQNIKFSDSSLLSKKEINDIKQILNFSSLNELKAYQWRGFDAGMAAASTLISATNETSPDPISNKKLINKLIHSYKITTIATQKWVNKLNPDKIYFCNGRISSVRPILRICEREGIAYEMYDRGHNKFSYSSRDFVQHDYKKLQQSMIQHWDTMKNETVKKSYAQKFFIDRRLKIEQSWVVFTKDQEINLLPENWDKNKCNIVFYTSSTDEYEAVSDALNVHKLYTDQISAIQDINSFCKSLPNTHFYVRLHPHLAKKSEKDRVLWDSLSEDGMNVILYNSKVDSYKLMESADLVITYGSTMGAEASYWGKPSICIANSHYDLLNISYNPETKKELYKLLSTKELKPVRSGRYIYGYFMASFGTYFKYYKPETFHAGKFNGINILNSRFIRIVSFVEKLFIKAIRLLEKIFKISKIRDKFLFI